MPNSGMTLERLQVIIEAVTKPYKDAMNEVQQKTTQTTQHVEKQTSRIKNALKKIGAVVAVAFSIAAIVNFGKSCVQLGSDLAEVQNVVDVTFGSMSSSVNAFANDAIEQFGLSETMAKKYMGTYGAMAKAFGFGMQQTYDMSAAITGLTGDVASFYNLSTDEAYTKLKSIFTGETESLKDLGVVMTQTALDQYALNNGFGRTTAKMTEQEKVMLRYQFVMSQLSDASGDFARTSGGWANQVRVLSLRFDQLKATIGQGLINALTPVIRVINTVIARLQVFSEYFRALTAALFGDNGSSGGSIGNAADAAGSIASSMGSAAGASKELKRNLMGFDQINRLASPESGSGGNGSSGSMPAVGEFNFGTIKTDNLVDTSGISATVAKINQLLEPLRKINLDPLKKALNAVVEAASPLGKNIFSGLEWAYYNILIPLASWTIEDALPAFLYMLSGAIDVVNSVIDALKPLALWLFDNFLKPVASWTGGIIVDILMELGDALKGVSDWIQNNQSIVAGMAVTVGIFFAAWEVTKIAEFVINAGGLIGVLTLITSKIYALTLAKLADKAETIAIVALYAKDLIVSLAKGTVELATQAVQWIAATAAKVADTAATIAATAATTAATAATWLFNAALAVLTSPITLVVLAIGALIAIVVLLITHWDEVKAKASEVWSKVTEIFKDFDNFLTGIFEKDWTDSFGAFGEILNLFSVSVKNVWNSIKRIFGGIIDFISGVFSGDWRKAWTGVKNIFGGIMDGLGALIKAPLNGVIGLVNGVIGGLNKIKIPDWDFLGDLAGKGFNIPKINYLAKGGVVASPTMAMIGEAGKEAVIPLERNTGWMDKVAQRVSLYSNNGVTKQELMDVMVYVFNKYMHFYIGDQDIARHAQKGQAEIGRRYSPQGT